jgi:hypothetical protein
MVAHDDRGDDFLAYGVWAADAKGKLDTKRAPDTIIFPYEHAIAIGQASMCDPWQFPLKRSIATLAVAALDDAGNASRAITIRADLTRATP